MLALYACLYVCIGVCLCRVRFIDWVDVLVCMDVLAMDTSTCVHAIYLAELFT